MVFSDWQETIPHLATHKLCHVTNARRELPLRAAVVAFSLLDLDQLLIQRLLLQEQPLGLPSLYPKLLLQGQDHSLLPFDLIHLEKKKKRPSGVGQDQGGLFQTLN